MAILSARGPGGLPSPGHGEGSPGTSLQPSAVCRVLMCFSLTCLTVTLWDRQGRMTDGETEA